jgi:hypothetical protein
MSFFTSRDENTGWSEPRWGRIVALSLAILIMPSVTWIVVSPQYRLWKAGIERQIQIRDAESRAKAAVQLAQAEVNRAKGVAEANKIIAGSITPEYLRYFYIQELSRVEQVGGKIIYVPTEAGLPILEAGRLDEKP